MRGFQPQGRGVAPAQNYADGGIVSRVRGFFGAKPKPEKVQLPEQQVAQASGQDKNPAAQAQEQAPTKPQRAITQYSSGSALERRMREAGAYANGGPVRGPGTGTSDDVPDKVAEGTYIMPADSTAAMGEQALEGMGQKGVPVNLSNGEFKLPPKQVHAVGVQALDQIKNATHTPVGFAPGAQQGQEPEPRMFFANGGVVDDERRQPISPSNTFPQGSPSAGAPIYQGAGFTADQFGSSGQFAQVPASIGQQPGRQPAPASPAPAAVGLPAAAPAAQVAPQASAPSAQSATEPQQGMAAFGFNPNLTRQAANRGMPAAATQSLAASVPATQVEGWRTKAVMDGAAQDAQAAWDRGGVEGVAGAAGAVARGAITAVPTAVGEFAYNTVAPLAGAAKGFWDGLTGDSSAPAAIPTAQALANPANAAPAGTGGGRSTANPGPVSPAAPAPVMQPQAREVMPGVFRSGNSYGDSEQAAITGPQTRGMPTAQNMARADALATGTAGAGPAARGFGPAAGASSSADSALLAARQAAAARGDMSAVRDSYFAQGQSFGGQTREGMQAEQLRQLALSPLGTPGRKAAQQMYAQQLQASTAREAQQVTRDGQQANTGIAQQRLGLEAGELGMRQQAAGFQTRAAQRMEDLQTAYQAAKPAERADLARQIRELQGKAETGNLRDNFMTVGGGQEWDATAGVMRNVPQRLMDLRNGQEVSGGQRAPAAAAGPAQPKNKAEYDALPKGSTYMRNGVTYTKE